MEKSELESQKAWMKLELQPGSAEEIPILVPQYIELVDSLIDDTKSESWSFVSQPDPKIYGFVVHSQIKNGNICVFVFNNLTGFELNKDPDWVLTATLEEIFKTQIISLNLHKPTNSCCQANNLFNLKRLNASGKQFLKQFASNYYKQLLVHKIGLIERMDGVQTENQLFQEQRESEEMRKLLDFLGREINLLSHDGYNGDTGIVDLNLIYQKAVDSHEFLFHVCTRFPYKPTDEQQLERKRHIGNDNVVIVFDHQKEFEPENFITSQQVKVYVVLKSYGQHYQISVFSRDIDLIEGYVKDDIDLTNEQDKQYFQTLLANCCISCFTDKLLFMRKQRGWTVLLQDYLRKLGNDLW